MKLNFSCAIKIVVIATSASECAIGKPPLVDHQVHETIYHK